MNFLCHAIPYFDRPVVAVCTGIPDWLSVIDRKIRARRPGAAAAARSDDAVLRDAASGVLAHLDDDHWFHSTDVFTRLNLQFAVTLRDHLSGDEGFRPSFVGHIIIEMLLDASYVVHSPDLVDSYYNMVRHADHESIQQAVNEITGKPTHAIAPTMRRFVEIGFLYDYSTDEGLLFRVNQVLRRVGLPPMSSPAVLDWVAEARRQVIENHARLLSSADGVMRHPELM
ncbi:MAG: hypothetical protein AAGJ40_08675 [Planctomycetota bacterium]